jgi:hypothetical protein
LAQAHALMKLLDHAEAPACWLPIRPSRNHAKRPRGGCMRSLPPSRRRRRPSPLSLPFPSSPLQKMHGGPAACMRCPLLAFSFPSSAPRRSSPATIRPATVISRRPSRRTRRHSGRVAALPASDDDPHRTPGRPIPSSLFMLRLEAKRTALALLLRWPCLLMHAHARESETKRAATLSIGFSARSSSAIGNGETSELKVPACSTATLS